MVLDDSHINYLRLVSQGIITIWWNPTRTLTRYVCSDWANGRKDVNQTVAAQMKALGMTHVVREGTRVKLALTEKGEKVLLEEDEAWA